MSDETQKTPPAVDAATLAAIAELKEKFGVKTNAEVVRKCLSEVRSMTQGSDK